MINDNHGHYIFQSQLMSIVLYSYFTSQNKLYKLPLQTTIHLN